ncbi:YdeI/OmpD-associated family protein [Isosphaeraceae bacterium EP7]
MTRSLGQQLQQSAVEVVMDPSYFATPADFRAWLAANHDQAEFLLVGFHKKGTGQPSLTWPESVDEALCFGWIDGVRKGVDTDRYTIRFTPRKAGSIWSSVNIAKVQVLTEQGRMQPAGLAAFEKRKDARSGIYSHEQESVELTEPYLGTLRGNAAAWEFFEKQPAGYRKAASWWVASAKQEKTRQSRFEKLVAYSAKAERVPQFTWKKSDG